MDGLPTTKTLEVLWQAEVDILTFQDAHQEKQGFASLVVVCAKLILQDMWMKGLNWDDAIHHELSN